MAANGKVRSPLAAYVDEVKKRRGWSATALAKAAGVSPSTILRPLNNPAHRFSLSLSTLRSIAKASGVPVPRELIFEPLDMSNKANTQRDSDVSTREPHELPAPNDVGGRGTFQPAPVVRIGEDGTLEIPADLVVGLEGHPGEALVARVVDGVLTVETVDNALRRVRASVRRYVPEGVSLVDELIAERRAEAARE